MIALLLAPLLACGGDDTDGADPPSTTSTTSTSTAEGGDGGDGGDGGVGGVGGAGGTSGEGGAGGATEIEWVEALGWVRQNPSLETMLFDNVDFFDTQTGWAVGHGIFKTTDGGASWHQLTTAPQLNDVDFVSSNHGWVVGMGGTILHTADGGTVWQSQMTPTASELSAVHFVDALNGWAVGKLDQVLHTDDGGASWSAQALPTAGCLTESVSDVHFVDPSTGFVVGGDCIFRTNDGGAVWQVALQDFWGFSAIHFADAQHGVAVDFRVWTTTDGGISWNQQSGTLPMETEDVVMLNSQRICAVGWNGMNIACSADGGASFQQPPTDTDGYLYGAHFADDGQHGWAVGRWGVTLVTTNGGQSWGKLGDGIHATSTLREVSILGEKAWVAGETPGLTTDQGQTWHAVPFAGESLTAVSFVSADRGWVAGRAIYRTDDGGSTWVEQTTPYSSFTVNRPYYRDVFFVDELTGWAVGNSAQSSFMLHTSDGGASWTKSQTFVWQAAALFFRDSQRGWAVGGQAVRLTLDGGGSWQLAPSLEGLAADVFFIDNQNGWVASRFCDDQAFVARSTDGGLSWDVVGATAGGYPAAITFVDTQRGWLVGENGLIFHTQDGGVSWTEQASTTLMDLHDIQFVTPEVGWVVGGGGTILHTTNGGQ